MRSLSITDDQLIENIASIHEYYLEKSGLNYHATTLSIALRQEMIERRLNMNQDIIYVIESKHDFREPSAFIWGHFETSTKVVTIEMLYTHPHCRNSGIATNLKLALEQWAIEKDAHSIKSTVDANNEQMIHINREQGYDITHVKMRKDLK
ncbi:MULTISPECIES: GNAT family N-acetyltransferase [Staphylococcus]|uniref:GNAT family N-acetyltransferase n=1 Tax=Staphylococcus hominis TaxID=1290 RepID=A0A3S7GTW1_STAHO|nr:MULTISPECIES: GNAT family N-acetyltransferase [Staphylococcus]EUZ68960.1 hypothetical protein O552_01180 [Staphylococcus sp. M0480]MBF9295357.1 GNAT family N-acetyltransferase [Staphylococcus epidermidis]OFM78446.1 GNAT family acetyltransferase [Staphylococcus sp. HMSC074B09]OFM95031.1 GNAT family acetyltransferase [Staphylococcus sp. HMSC078D05]OFS48403.1 GNAT family acetyltransferase [Staphylococcus sp. HMSC075H09]OHO60581.1 GNAT family acetyltransferase [Staphylococcus sp. HMSC035F02]